MKTDKKPVGQNAQLKERERFNDLLEKRKGFSPHLSLYAFYLYAKNSLQGYNISIGNLGIVKVGDCGQFWINKVNRMLGIIIEDPNTASKTIVIPAKHTGIEIKAYSISKELEDCILEWGGPVFVSETCRTHNRKGLIRHRSSIDASYVKFLEKGGEK